MPSCSSSWLAFLSLDRVTIFDTAVGMITPLMTHLPFCQSLCSTLLSSCSISPVIIRRERTSVSRKPRWNPPQISVGFHLCDCTSTGVRRSDGVAFTETDGPRCLALVSFNDKFKISRLIQEIAHCRGFKLVRDGLSELTTQEPNLARAR